MAMKNETVTNGVKRLIFAEFTVNLFGAKLVDISFGISNFIAPNLFLVYKYLPKLKMVFKFQAIMEYSE